MLNVILSVQQKLYTDDRYILHKGKKETLSRFFILSNVTKKVRTMYLRYKRYIYVQSFRLFLAIFSDISSYDMISFP